MDLRTLIAGFRFSFDDPSVPRVESEGRLYMMHTDKVIEAADEFAGTFGLRSFPGATGFWINVRESYEDSNGGIQLYVFNAGGKAFAKGTPAELRGLVVGRIEAEGSEDEQPSHG